MFKLFWHKYHCPCTDPHNKIWDMWEWCAGNLGKPGKVWSMNYRVSKFGSGVTNVTFKFRNREDYVMFLFCNL
jgi:hypothetical protein